ncbi:bifunctional riboflavin kinase/FAD synthetase [Planktosalinus lacus]|uniref:Riboflavin biosynthesis protein n=1 Tax=Planktosalinus lacus TaxID=1526573 RepID=A0A8J2Y8P8_9FLAO|nr:bifunctional riboflavin kinase/FAD synthetase [Planktosalinus lacus]GGD82106.1 riboflavin biosynthesis protein [Planktosalinus lacus]
MQVHHSIENFKIGKPTIVTIGTFDGVHVGHKEILKKLTFEANRLSLDSVILTFFPHPRMVLQKDSDIKLINTIDERVAIFSKTNLDHLIIHPFTKEFSNLSAETYVKTILVDSLNVKKIIIGYDHRFGHNRTANIDDLKRFGNKFGFEVEEISAQELDDVAVSSTKIRRALDKGDLETANSYLGYPFMLTGTVVKGKGIGKTINFPTANLQIKENYKLIPKNGVYVVKSLLDGNNTFGLMSIGTNPTVGGTSRTIETYFLNTDKDLYGKQLEIELLTKIRDEETFDSMKSLQQAIKSDEAIARKYIKTHVQ